MSAAGPPESSAATPAPAGGPLAGLRVLELAGLGPVPFAAMVLADLGAEVLRVDRPGTGAVPDGLATPVLDRGRAVVTADLKSAAGQALVARLSEHADVLLEGLRPGVIERLGLAPDRLLERNPRLVVGRMTGWGQHGPMAGEVGHDITYLAISGALASCARDAAPPVPPINLLGDFGGGGMLLLVGVLAALYERQRSGRGQVIDAAMVDGVALLASMVHALAAADSWDLERPGTNLLDTGAPFYDVYRTADDRFVAVGALEPRFYRALLAGLGLAEDAAPDRDDRAQWPALRALLAARFGAGSRAHWEQVFAGTEACVAPVLTFAEAHRHPHLRARGTYPTVAGSAQPAPAPRFSRTPGAVAPQSLDPDRLLDRWGLGEPGPAR
jgi:crotonobetainyl-CoA:carnitine CoA-transferase CaiB-like acyl-CoA transferase